MKMLYVLHIFKYCSIFSVLTDYSFRNHITFNQIFIFHLVNKWKNFNMLRKTETSFKILNINLIKRNKKHIFNNGIWVQNSDYPLTK